MRGFWIAVFILILILLIILLALTLLKQCEQKKEEARMEARMEAKKIKMITNRYYATNVFVVNEKIMLTNITTNEVVAITETVVMDRKNAIFLLGSGGGIGIGYQREIGEWIGIQWSIGGGVLIRRNEYEVFLILQGAF